MNVIYQEIENYVHDSVIKIKETESGNGLQLHSFCGFENLNEQEEFHKSLKVKIKEEIISMEFSSASKFEIYKSNLISKIEIFNNSFEEKHFCYSNKRTTLSGLSISNEKIEDWEVIVSLFVQSQWLLIKEICNFITGDSPNSKTGLN